MGRFWLRSSLFWKISLSTSVAITLLLGVAGYLVQSQTRATLSQNLQAELQGSFRAYGSLWQARTGTLRSVSLVLSNMSDVRRAFQTNDRATIQDTASEIWSKLSQSHAMFLVTDPRGEVIASLGGGDQLANGSLDVVRQAEPKFPAQSDGFALVAGQLYEFVVTPVYVQTQGGSGLLNVLVAGFPVDAEVARDLKAQTGGSDFVFLEAGRAAASSLSANETSQIAAQYKRDSKPQQINLAGHQFAVLGSTLGDVAGTPAGDLLIVHNYDAIGRELDALTFKLILIWIAAIFAGLAISVALARQIIKPIRDLDQAAALIGEQQYKTRVPEGGNDELGRLARTFNTMCASIEDAREELIRQERIATIGRLSSSIVHDLRNPLASIYGGAEMMMDGDLKPEQTQRVATNIYRSSRAIKDMLQELVDVSRGRSQTSEMCRLSEVIDAAVDSQMPVATQQGIEIEAHIDPVLELPLERARVERVFNNLISNAIEAMPEGGHIRIAAEISGHDVTVCVDDTGPGIPEAVRRRLFQPFVSSRRNGLGLGLALSRQAILDHGGDLWIEEANGHGAQFRVKLPSHS